SHLCFFFFFSSRRRHTRFSRDWSSDVCSSDLVVIRKFRSCSGGHHLATGNRPPSQGAVAGAHFQHRRQRRAQTAGGRVHAARAEIGRASCRERGEVRVVGGRLSNKVEKRT